MVFWARSGRRAQFLPLFVLLILNDRRDALLTSETTADYLSESNENRERPRQIPQRHASARRLNFGDRAFRWLTLLMALSVFVLIVLTGYELPRLAARAAKIRLAFSLQQRLGPGQRRVWRAAVYFRHACFIIPRAAHRGAVEHRHGRISHGTRAAVGAPAAHHLHRTARRRAERDPRVVGNLRHGAVAAGAFFSLAARDARFLPFFRARFTASACWPAASSSPS